ncbi:hypothetical protein BVY01_05305 [bacterium I07]|nr:hypothetical protein BVY01_05305 [bacterium I07]
MSREEKLLRDIVNLYKKKNVVKTPECPSEETMWEIVTGEYRDKGSSLQIHIDKCPYCLQVSADIGFYLNPPKIDVPEEISERVTKTINKVFSERIVIQILFTKVKEKSHELIERIVQLTDKGLSDIPFETIPSFVMGNKQEEKEEKEENDFSFSTSELEVSIYHKENDLTLSLDEGKNFSRRKEIDEYEAVLIQKDGEPTRQKAQDGIIKFENVEITESKILIE